MLKYFNNLVIEKPYKEIKSEVKRRGYKPPKKTEFKFGEGSETLNYLFEDLKNKEPNNNPLTKEFINKIYDARIKYTNMKDIENEIRKYIKKYEKSSNNEDTPPPLESEIIDIPPPLEVETKKRGRPRKEVKDMPPLEVETKIKGRPKKEVKKEVKNLLNCLYKYPVKMLNQFKIDYNLDDIKGWYKLNKDEKVERLKVEIKNCDNLPPVPKRIYAEKEYGVRGGNIIKYNAEEQKNFLAVNYENVHPLISKRLDKIKNKRAYEQNIDIKLNKHQKDAVMHFIDPYFKGGLFFHSVGSGKSLTAVALSHYYLSLFPTHKVVVLTPPSLLFNFVDAMRLFGLDVKDNRYTFQTFQKFAKNYTAYVDNKTLLIIDEVHILRTEPKIGMIQNEAGEVKTVIKKGKLPKTIIDACSLCDKVLCMTGTAFVNELYDIENIMSMINGGVPPTDRGTFQNIIRDVDMTYDYFKHKISYYNIFDTELKRFFPEIRTIYVGLKLESPFNEIFGAVVGHKSPYADIDNYQKFKKGGLFGMEEKFIEMPEMDEYGRLGFRIVNNERNKNKKDDDDDDGEIFEDDKDKDKNRELKGFYVYQRQYANIINGEKIKFIIKKLKENPNKQSIIYSSFIQSSLSIIVKKLNENKILFTTIVGDDSITKRKKAVLDYNDKKVQVLIISRAGTEGVDTKDTQMFFLYEPQWNRATEEQAIARSVRFKSHNNLDEKQRYVEVYRLLVFLNDDEKFFDLLKDGKTDSFLTDREQNETKLKLMMKDIKKFIKDTEYDFEGKEFKKFYTENTKRPKGGFNYTPPTKEDIRYRWLIRLIYNGKKGGIFNEYYKKYASYINKLNENNELRMTYPKSPDLILEYNSTSKQKSIEEFLKNFKRNIPKIEDYDDEYHRKLLKVLDDEKDPTTLIKKQRDIINQNVNRAIKQSSKVMQLLEEGKRQTKMSLEKKEEKIKTVGLQEFFTPPEIGDLLISYSNKAKQKNIKVLEPSAGMGSLVNSLLKVNKDVNIDMVEFSDTNRKVLKDYADRVPSLITLKETKDFMEFKSGLVYDLIIMNPPFNVKGYKGGSLVDMDFVKKAYKDHLKNGGEILAIVSGYYNKPKHKEFINKVDLEEVKRFRDYNWKGSDGKKIKLNFVILKIKKGI